MSLFSSFDLAPGDPILGLNEAFSKDSRAMKVNLGIGVYYDHEGRIPLLQSVKSAQELFVETGRPHAYIPIDGLPEFDERASRLLFGDQWGDRVVTVQTLGGTGALRTGADFLHALSPKAKVAISDPSWPNHLALFGAPGFEIEFYPYYDPQTKGFDFEGALAAIETLKAGDIIVLHACCHNPTGIDPDETQWQTLLERVRERRLIPFFDLAYQGFGDGIDEDTAVIRAYAKTGEPFLVAHSFSKSFSLYGERIGALSVVTDGGLEAQKVRSQLKKIIRANYSNPPTFGAAVVAEILGSDKLLSQWRHDMNEMRERIRSMRKALVEHLASLAVSRDFSYLSDQKGMFSYSGLTKSQVRWLREEKGLYALDNGRICIAALQPTNVDYAAQSIIEALSV